MRVRFKQLGGHIHCRVFTAPVPNETFAKNGELVFDEREFEDVRRIMSGAQFLREDEVSP